MMKQKLLDLYQRLCSDRRIWASCGFAVAVLLVWFLTAANQDKAGQKLRFHQLSQSGPMVLDSTYIDLVTSFNQRIEIAERDSKDMFAVLTRLISDIRENRSKAEGRIETLGDQVEQLSRELDALAQAFKIVSDEQPLVPGPGLGERDGIQVVGFDKPTVGSQPGEHLPVLVSVIAPGDTAPVQLITGIAAPTDGTPFPVLFSLTGSISGPNGVRLDLGDARLVATAIGSKSESRVLFQLSQLSIAHPNGRRTAVKVDGWVVGEDGLKGMKGKLESKLPELILATLGVSSLATLGDRLNNQSQLLVEKNPGLGASDIELVGASAFSDTSRVLVEVLRSQYESVVPVVEVLSGREVYVIFSAPAEIAILDQEAELVRAQQGDGQTAG